MALILDGLLRPVRRERKDCCTHSVSPGSYLIEPREPQVPSWYGNEEKREPGTVGALSSSCLDNKTERAP